MTGLIAFHYRSYGFFLPFVKSIKVFDEKTFESSIQNKEIILFCLKVWFKKCIQNQHLMLAII